VIARSNEAKACGIAMDAPFFKTGRQISETTIKRLYGFAVYNFSTSLYTLDTLACYTDFSTWKHWQEHLRQKESQMPHSFNGISDYSKLFYYSTEAMWIFAVGSLRFLEVNHAACKIYGYTREEFLSKTILEIRRTDQVSLLLQTVLEAGEYTRHRPFHHVLANGEVVLTDLRSFTFQWSRIPSRLVISIPFPRKHFKNKVGQR